MDQMTVCYVKGEHTELSPSSIDHLSSVELFCTFQLIVLVFVPVTLLFQFSPIIIRLLFLVKILQKATVQQQAAGKVSN